jgi:hypothetical protein
LRNNSSATLTLSAEFTQADIDTAAAFLKSFIKVS